MTVTSDPDSTAPLAGEPPSSVGARFSIAQRATLAVVAATEADRLTIDNALLPYQPAALDDQAGDVRIEVRDGRFDHAPLNVQGDAGDGLVTAWDGVGLRVFMGASSCRMSFDGVRGRALVELEPGFPLWWAWAEVARPLLTLALSAHGTAVAHASAVSIDGRGLAIAGWSESGKTELALALCEQGAHFVSDKWTALDDAGTLHAMPVSAGLRAWTLPHLPVLRARLPGRARLRLALGGLLDRTAAPATRALGRSPLGVAGARAVARAGGLAARLSLSPSEVRALQAAEPAAHVRVPLHRVVLLTTRPGPVQACPIAPEIAARRIASTSGYERRSLAAFDARLRYATGSGIPGWTELAEREQAIIHAACAAAGSIEVFAPFPADPRAAVEILSPHL